MLAERGAVLARVATHAESGGCRSRSRGCGRAPTTTTGATSTSTSSRRSASAQLSKVNPDDLDLLYAELLAGGRKKQGGTSKGLAPKTVRNVHVMLNKALSDATRRGLVVRNVAELADPPSVGAQRRDGIKAWDADQLCVFLDAIEPHRLFPAYYLSANTGMRRGEILGLRWGDLDLERGLISGAAGADLGRLQSADLRREDEQRRRTIDIEDDVVEVLEEWRDRRLAKSGQKKMAQTDLVFAKPDGSWIHPDFFSQTFDRTVVKLDAPEISLHDLRHTHATILLKDGTAVKVVSERLGHANPAFPMSVYQHVLPGMQAEAAAAFSRILQTARGKKKERVDSNSRQPSSAGSGAGPRRASTSRAPSAS